MSDLRRLLFLKTWSLGLIEHFVFEEPLLDYVNHDLYLNIILYPMYPLSVSTSIWCRLLSKISELTSRAVCRKFIGCDGWVTWSRLEWHGNHWLTQQTAWQRLAVVDAAVVRSLPFVPSAHLVHQLTQPAKPLAHWRTRTGVTLQVIPHSRDLARSRLRRRVIVWHGGIYPGDCTSLVASEGVVGGGTHAGKMVTRELWQSHIATRPTYPPFWTLVSSVINCILVLRTNQRVAQASHGIARLGRVIQGR